MARIQIQAEVASQSSSILAAAQEFVLRNIRCIPIVLCTRAHVRTPEPHSQGMLLVVALCSDDVAIKMGTQQHGSWLTRPVLLFWRGGASTTINYSQKHGVSPLDINRYKAMGNYSLKLTVRLAQSRPYLFPVVVVLLFVVLSLLFVDFIRLVMSQKSEKDWTVSALAECTSMYSYPRTNINYD